MCCWQKLATFCAAISAIVCQLTFLIILDFLIKYPLCAEKFCQTPGHSSNCCFLAKSYTWGIHKMRCGAHSGFMSSRVRFGSSYFRCSASEFQFGLVLIPISSAAYGLISRDVVLILTLITEGGGREERERGGERVASWLLGEGHPPLPAVILVVSALPRHDATYWRS